MISLRAAYVALAILSVLLGVLAGFVTLDDYGPVLAFFTAVVTAVIVFVAALAVFRHDRWVDGFDE